MNQLKTDKFSKSRIATIDVGSLAQKKHHVTALLEIDVSVLVEKEIDGENVPIRLVIEDVNNKSTQAITHILAEEKNKSSNKNEIVLQKETTKAEQFYYLLRVYAPDDLAFYVNVSKYNFQKKGECSHHFCRLIGKNKLW